MAIWATTRNPEAALVFPNLWFIHHSNGLLRLEPSVASQEAGDGVTADRPRGYFGGGSLSLLARRIVTGRPRAGEALAKQRSGR
jgi:hypothetical protein